MDLSIWKSCEPAEEWLWKNVKWRQKYIRIWIKRSNSSCLRGCQLSIVTQNPLSGSLWCCWECFSSSGFLSHVVRIQPVGLCSECINASLSLFCRCVVWTGDDRVFFFNPTMHLSVWEKPVDLKDRGDLNRIIEDPPHKRKKDSLGKILSGKNRPFRHI